MSTWCQSTTPKNKSFGLASSAFARHYLRNLGWCLFLALLRCFSSGGSLRTTIWFIARYMDIVHVGCPIRKSTDQWIFAPSRGLSQLVTSFVGSWCQGIPLALFIAWPIKNKINLVLVVNYAGFTDCFLWNCNRYPSIRCSTIKITSCSVLFQAQTSLLPYLSLS